MKKLSNALFSILVVALLITPTVAMAAWWNPLTWFQTAPTAVVIPPTSQTQRATTAQQGENNDLSNTNTYTNVSGNKVHAPSYSENGQAPDGATAQCGDGTYSFSQHHSGTCSHHGGVSQWLPLVVSTDTNNSTSPQISNSITQDSATNASTYTTVDTDQEHRVAQMVCQAIAEIKTNKNYDANGKSNTFGAYEYTLGFWQMNSQKYFGVSSLDVTPENQDRLCLAYVYDRLNKSFNIPQVLSMWIAGDSHPNAYLAPNYKGVNSFGEYYDVPAQVKSIQDRFDTLNGW